jgi:hypothetical protein
MQKPTIKTVSIFLFLLITAFLTAQDRKSANEISYTLEEDIAYYDINDQNLDEYKRERCRLDIYYPTNIPDFNTLVWFHGGGLRAGEKLIPEELKEKGIAVIAVNYRLYPIVKCPTYIEDAAAAVAWTFNNIEKYGGNSGKIYLSGHSAGGYLVSMLGLDKKWLSQYNIDADSIAGLIPFSGHTITHFTVREERGIPGEQPVIDEFAPLFHVREDAPLLILITGDRELELLGRYEENAYLMRMMKVAGHKNTHLFELQGFDHVEMVSPAFGILLKYLKE